MVMETIQSLFRWLHAVAGVLWIGMAYYMSFVLMPQTVKWPGDARRALLPGLLRTSIVFGRWSSLFSWVTGLLLLGLVFHAGGLMFDDPTRSWNSATGVMMTVVFIGFVFYDLAVKSGAFRSGWVAGIVGLAATAGIYEGMLTWAGMGYRSTLVHIGVLYGTIMTANVWMRIVPPFRRVVIALETGGTPDPADFAEAALRARHNTYLSVPILWTMLNLHTYVPGASSSLWFYGVVAASWFLVSLLFGKSTGPTPRQ